MRRECGRHGHQGSRRLFAAEAAPHPPAFANNVIEPQPERLGNHLARRGGSEKLAAATRRAAGFASELGCAFQGYFTVGVARAHRLNFAEIFGLFGE